MQDQIVIGKIVAPHGVRGDIRILPQTETPELFLELDYLLLENGQKLNLARARFQKNLVLVSTQEIQTMDEAEKLRGKNVLIKKEDLPKLPEGRFYVSDLIGFLCVDSGGNKIGKFKDTLQTGSTDVFVIINDEGKEILVPAIAENILQIDTENKKMIVHLPEWVEAK